MQIAAALIVLLLLGAVVLLAHDPDASAAPVVQQGEPATAVDEQAGSPLLPVGTPSRPAGEVGATPSDQPVTATPAPADAAPGPTATPTQTPSLTLEPGVCFDALGGATTTGSIEPISCDGPHDNEIYVLATIPDSVYPGAESLEERAGMLCRGDAFTEYVGVSWAESRLFTASLFPSETSWAQGDRLLVCALYDLRGPRESSARGAGI